MDKQNYDRDEITRQSINCPHPTAPGPTNTPLEIIKTFMGDSAELLETKSPYAFSTPDREILPYIQRIISKDPSIDIETAKDILLQYMEPKTERYTDENGEIIETDILVFNKEKFSSDYPQDNLY